MYFSPRPPGKIRLVYCRYIAKGRGVYTHNPLPIRHAMYFARVSYRENIGYTDLVLVF